MDRLNDADPNGSMGPIMQTLRDNAPTWDADLNERIDAEGNPTTDTSGLLVDRCDRSVVAYYQDAQGRWKPSALKAGDDVICAGMPLRVAGPARGRGYFSGYYEPWFGDAVVPIEAAYVTERAPADSGETPMPIIPGTTP